MINKETWIYLRLVRICVIFVKGLLQNKAQVEIFFNY